MPEYYYNTFWMLFNSVRIQEIWYKSTWCMIANYTNHYSGLYAFIETVLPLMFVQSNFV